MEKKSKYLIYIVAIDHPTSKNKCTDYAQYCVKTWTSYCTRHDIDLQICTEHDDRFGRPIWNKELISEHGKDYDKIGVVDSDTMVKWDAPNIFETFDNGFCGVVDTGDFGWILNSMKAYNKFFPDINLDIDSYFNAGVLFFSNEHLTLFGELLEFYLDNKEELDKWTLGGGREQTLLNYIVKKNNVELNVLTPEWNLFGIHKKDMFKPNWQLKLDNTPFFMKYANIWHFTGFPVEQRQNIMNRVWEQNKHRYE